jgi:hypothetical protein
LYPSHKIKNLADIHKDFERVCVAWSYMINFQAAIFKLLFKMIGVGEHMHLKILI